MKNTPQGMFPGTLNIPGIFPDLSGNLFKKKNYYFYVIQYFNFSVFIFIFSTYINECWIVYFVIIVQILIKQLNYS